MPTDFIAPAKSLAQRLALLEALCAQADALRKGNRHAQVGAVDARIAQEVLGWHTDPEDAQQLWRVPSGEPLVFRFAWLIKPAHICRHPWVEGVNGLYDMTFSPGHNYHRNFHDWRAWTRRALQEGYSPKVFISGEELGCVA